MEKKYETTPVQNDKFWTWRVNREEELIMKERDFSEEMVDNVRRLREGVERAREVAAGIKRRQDEKIRK